MADSSSPPSHRASSPSAWTSPSLALSASNSNSDRVFSSASSQTSVSRRSSLSTSNGVAVPRRRGYMRPQATSFAESAVKRESVQSLGTIAHLQYYFARTGLLDGKGAQLAKDRKGSGGEARKSSQPRLSDMDFSSLSLATDSDSLPRLSDSFSPDDSALVDSPVDADDSASNWESQEPLMLPPTVSTYKHRTSYIAPPPEMEILRRELREALDAARQVLNEMESCSSPTKPRQANNGLPSPPQSPPPQTDEKSPTSQGFHEIQGLHLLDLSTLAIKAAKTYYTSHEHPYQLYAIIPERQLRNGLYDALGCLKRLAGRNFKGGISHSEKEGLESWFSTTLGLLGTEEEKERAEQEERDKWSWRDGDWGGREREREWLFMKSFDPNPDDLPPWTEAQDGQLPTPFFEALRNGLRLVLLHNALVRKSPRQFEEIKVWHTDTNKPYRCAENLRYWIKAAELRWEAKLKVDVMGVVQGTSDEAWKQFDQALLTWCRTVREELTAEWKEQHRKTLALIRPPTLHIDAAQVVDSGGGGARTESSVA